MESKWLKLTLHHTSPPVLFSYKSLLLSKITLFIHLFNSYILNFSPDYKFHEDSSILSLVHGCVPRADMRGIWYSHNNKHSWIIIKLAPILCVTKRDEDLCTAQQLEAEPTDQRWPLPSTTRPPFPAQLTSSVQGMSCLVCQALLPALPWEPPRGAGSKDCCEVLRSPPSDGPWQLPVPEAASGQSRRGLGRGQK